MYTVHCTLRNTVKGKLFLFRDYRALVCIKNVNNKELCNRILEFHIEYAIEFTRLSLVSVKCTLKTRLVFIFIL